MFSIEEEGAALLELLLEIQQYCKDPASIHARKEAVSLWSVSQHCEHILKADRLNLRAIELLLSGGGEEGEIGSDSHPVLVSGRIPRGVAQAPTYVVPASEPQIDQLIPMAEKLISGWTESLEKAKPLSPPFTRGVGHHEIGLLDIPGWVRFARVHTDHHLLICRQIVDRDH